MALVGALPHLYLYSSECLLVWQAGEMVLFWRFLLILVLLCMCTDAVAMSLILRVADMSTWPTIWESGSKFEKLKGPFVSAFIFAAVNATGASILTPALHLRYGIATLVIFVLCTWLLYGGCTFLIAFFTNDCVAALDSSAPALELHEPEEQPTQNEIGVERELEWGP
jgi:hypothetical protein